LIGIVVWDWAGAALAGTAPCGIADCAGKLLAGAWGAAGAALRGKAPWGTAAWAAGAAALTGKDPWIWLGWIGVDGSSS
jgi:hypothetical protein